MWPLLPTMMTGRVVPRNLAIGTTLSLPSLICMTIAYVTVKHTGGCHAALAIGTTLSLPSLICMTIADVTVKHTAGCHAALV